MSKLYNHAFDIAFEVKGSKCPDGTDITEQMFKNAMSNRIETLLRERNWKEAIGAPFDTYQYSNEYSTFQLKADAMLTVEQLEDVYNQDGDGEYPDARFDRSAWRHEVACENAASGYWQWLRHMLAELSDN